MELTGKVKAKLHNSFHALSHRNFRYFWIGQCISLIGTWMQNMGQSWLVLSLTNSPFLLGLVGALQFTPMLVFSLFAGVIVDRFPKKKILLLTQSTMLVLALTLAVLVWTGQVRYWHILALATFLGCVNTLDMPTRQAFMVELVGKEDLMNAIALNSSIFNAARIIGPALAGVLMGYFGIAFCFFANALSFVAVLFGILQIRVKPFVKRQEKSGEMLAEIKEGLVYIRRKPVLWRTILTLAVMGIFAMNFSVLIPVFVKNVLHQQEAGFGFMMSAMGMGSFIGAVVTAANSKRGPRKSVFIGSAMTVSVLLVVLGMSSTYAVTAVLLAVTGAFNIVFLALANSTMQLNADDHFRGRVMSVYTLVFGGTAPLGNFLTGGVTDKFGPRAGFIITGLATLFCLTVLLVTERRSVQDAQPSVAEN